MQYPNTPRLPGRVTPLFIHCGISRRLQFLVAGIYLFAVCMLLWLAVVHSTLFAAAIPVLSVYTVWCYRSQVSRTGRQAVTELYRCSDGGWQIHFRSGQRQQAVLLGDSIVLPAMIILKFKTPGFVRPCSVVLMPDALGQNKYRRVCVQLLTVKV